MNLKKLNDHELHLQTSLAAENEQSATLILLEYLSEIDERLLYSKHAYSSLWQYVHLALKYSEAQASERVAAMRLMRKIPEVRVAIEEKRLTLTSTAKIASFLRNEKPSPEKTLALVEACKDKSTRQVESFLLSQSTAVTFEKKETIKAVSTEFTRITFDADREMMHLIEELKNQHIDPFVSVKELIREALKSRKEIVFKKKGLFTKYKKPDSALRAPEVTIDSGLTRYIAKRLKISIQKRSRNQCEHVDSDSGRRCDSKKALHFDHIHPFAKGGKSLENNLRILCANHNRYYANQHFGKHKFKIEHI